MSSLFGDIATATQQAAKWVWGPSGFLVHLSKSNLKLKIEKKNWKKKLIKKDSAIEAVPSYNAKFSSVFYFLIAVREA